MKKLILAAVVVFSTIAFSACTKENNVQPHKANTLQDGGVGIPPAGDKGNLGQGD